MKQSLWNRNFMLYICGMAISALGGIGLNLALSVVVFEQTQSTLLASVFTAISMIPHFIMPLFVGPYIDRHNPLKVLLRNESFLAVFFLAAAAIVHVYGFHYYLYLLITLLTSSFGVISRLASESMAPQLMEQQYYSKGNAIINLVYPLASVIAVPIVMKLFQLYGVTFIFALYAITTILDIAIESQIKVSFEFIETETTTWNDYVQDLKEGYHYVRNDTAVLVVFIYFACVMFAEGSSSLIYPFFNQHPQLTNDHYATLQSIRSLGYLAGGFLHYFIHIPNHKRYLVALVVYLLFVFADGSFFFMPFALMCAAKFFLGIAGMNSANIRVSAIQTRVPARYRAKVNAFYSILVFGAQIIGELAAGSLGEWLDYRWIQIGMSTMYLVAIIILVLPKKHKVKELYNFELTPVENVLS